MDNKKSHQGTELRLIQGYLHCAWSYHSLRIVAAPEHAPPFHIDAMAFEEDTWLTMSAEPTVCEPEVHPVRLMTELIEAQPEKVGSVLVQGGNPVRLLAVVYDVDEEPTWKASWIESALSELFRVVQRRGFKSIGLPSIGTRHGKLSAPQFAVILGRVMRKAKWGRLENLWLVSPVGVNRTVMSILKNALP